MRIRTRVVVLLIVVTALVVVGCRDDRNGLPTTAPNDATRDRTPTHDIDPTTFSLVRQLAASRGVVRLPRPPHVRNELSELGQALAFDPILSGNKNISCMTCHLPGFATGDGKNVSVGEAGIGFGPNRRPTHGVFIPRNAPPLFNMAAMRHLFWDGRVQLDAHGAVQTPAGTQVTSKMQRVFEFGPISAIAMFPVTSRQEMRGESGNELATIDDANNPAIWAAIMHRLGAIPEYRRMFRDAYPGTRFDDMTFAYAANAIGGFIVDKFTFDDTPWDRFLAGDNRALNKDQLAGAQTFLTLKCALCHNGSTFSDEQFHDVAVAQIGPGEGDGATTHDDYGRMRVTNNPADRYLFRTTPLRNVELTAPYGHDGSVVSLRAFIDHYSTSDTKLQGYDPSQLDVALRGTLQPTIADILAQRDTLLTGVVLTDDIVTDLVNYMTALTDDGARHLNRLVPDRVPSHLPVVPRNP